MRPRICYGCSESRYSRLDIWPQIPDYLVNSFRYSTMARPVLQPLRRTYVDMGGGRGEPERAEGGRDEEGAALC